MKFIHSIFTIIFVFSAFLSFAQDRDDAYFDSMAQEVCDCSAKLLEYSEDVNKLEGEEDMEELYKLAELIQVESTKMEKCLAGVEQKYKDIDDNPTYQKRAKESLVRICPAFAKAMQGAGVEIEEQPEPVAPVPTPEPEPASPSYDDEYFKEMAMDICGCTDNVFDKVAKIELLQAEGKTEEAVKLANEIEGDAAEMEKCIDGFEGKYGSMEGSDANKKRVEDALKLYCPRFAAMMNAETTTPPAEEEIIEVPQEEEIIREEIIEEVEIAEEAVSGDDFYKQTMFDICDCIGSQEGLEDEYKKVVATEDAAKLMDFRMGLQQNYPGMFECMAKMNDRVSQLNKDEESRKKSKEAMIQHCPLFLDLMGLR